MVNDKDKKTTRSNKMPETSKDNLLDAIMEALKSDVFMQNLSHLISKTVSTEIEKVLKKQNETLINLEKNYQKLNENYNDLKLQVERTEWYSRRNNLRVLGVPEIENEDTVDVMLNILHDKLNLINITKYDIEGLHRIGARKKGSKHRTIMVRFANYRIRNEVYKAKSKLKGSKMSVKEDLTPRRLGIFMKACAEFNFRNVWTSEGITYVNYNNQVYKLEKEEDINEFMENTRKQEGRPES